MVLRFVYGLCLVPQDSFFVLFKHVASTLSKTVWPMLLKDVFTSKAQEAYSSLSAEYLLNYDKAFYHYCKQIISLV